jgi:hypothetical protein
MRERFIQLVFLLVGLINLAPVIGVAGHTPLEALYGASIPDPTLLLLMQHRAVLFGIIGGLLLIATFHRPLRTAATGAGGISMASFDMLYLLSDPAPASLLPVAAIDAVALAAMIVVFVAGRLAGLRGAALSGKSQAS